MTDRSTDAIREDIATAVLEFNKARDDAALYERLQRAAAEQRRLQSLCNKLTAELSSADDRDAKAAKAALAARFRKLDIIATPDPARDYNALSASYVVRYEQLAYDSNEHASVWQARKLEGLAMMPGDLCEYMFAFAPNALPDVIMALAPGNPAGALEAYFLAQRRWHVATPAPAD